MPQMAAAIGAMKLRPQHAMAGVGRGFHRPRLGVVKTGPAGAAVEFGRSIEQFGAAAGTLELAGALFMIQGTGTRTFGAMLDQNPVLFGREGAKGLGVCHGVS